MDADAKFTLSKEERLHGVRLTSRLFTGNEAHSMTVFPLRAVWLLAHYNHSYSFKEDVKKQQS